MKHLPGIQSVEDNCTLEAAKQQSKGFFGQWGAMLTANAGLKYLNMPLGAIMGEHPNNFFIATTRSSRLRLILTTTKNPVGANTISSSMRSPGRLNFPSTHWMRRAPATCYARRSVAWSNRRGMAAIRYNRKMGDKVQWELWCKSCVGSPG